MLQLVEIKETDIDDVNQRFILKFEDGNLSEEVWAIIKNDLINNKYQINCAEINAEAIIQLNSNHINLIITFPQIEFTTPNEEVDNIFEKLKNDFQEYYTNLTARVQLIPILAL